STVTRYKVLLGLIRPMCSTSTLRAQILSERHACRLACRLRMGRDLDAQITHAGLCVCCQAVEYLLPTPDEVQIGRVCKAFFGKHPSIRWKCLVPGGDRLRQLEGAAAVLGHADADEGHDARACATSGCRTSVQVRQHIGGNGARSTLAQRGAVDAFAGEAQHAWAKSSEEDRGVGGVNVEFGTGGQLLANHMCRRARQQRLQTVNKIARKGKWAIPGDPHALLGLLLGRRADTERKAPPECGLGGHGLLRQVNGM